MTDFDHSTTKTAEPLRSMGSIRPSDVDLMPPLLRSISSLLRLSGNAISPQFLLAGLDGEKNSSPRACLRAAARANFAGHIQERPAINAISSLTLPCILLLQNDRSCVLLACYTNKNAVEADCIFPEFGEDVRRVPLSELDKEYTGYALFGACAARVDDRAKSTSLPNSKDWFWGVLRHYAPIYSHVALASVIINCIGVITSLFVMNVYDRIVPNNAVESLWVLTIGVLIAYGFDALLRCLRSYFVDVAGRNADVVLSSTLVRKVLTMRLDKKPESTGALVNNIREFEGLRDFFGSSTLLACIDIPFLVLFLGLIFFIGGPLVFVPIAAIPLLLFSGSVLHKASKRHSAEAYQENMQKNAILVELVNGLETVKSCMTEAQMLRTWEKIVGLSAKTGSEARRYDNLAVVLSTLITQLVSVSMVVWGVYLIKDGSLSMGGLIACNILIGRAIAPLIKMAGLMTRWQNARMSLQSLTMLMELPSETQESKTSAMDFGKLEPSFSVKNLSFSYPNSPKEALRDISFHIRAGEKVAIIGRMGSGKSTIGKLLIGLYEAGQGSVSFGDVNIDQLHRADLRSRVGFLPQDVTLFYGSIRDNISMASPVINDRLLLRAAHLAGVNDFIRSHPAGFGTQVGEQGKALSGGQRQAVGLARALVRDPDVLILDEPTSNMDTASEKMLQERLQGILAERTLILITHRRTMLELVDRIIVLENGRIRMDGKKDAVLKALAEGGRASQKAQAQNNGNTATASVSIRPTVQNNGGK